MGISNYLYHFIIILLLIVIVVDEILNVVQKVFYKEVKDEKEPPDNQVTPETKNESTFKVWWKKLVVNAKKKNPSWKDCECCDSCSCCNCADCCNGSYNFLVGIYPTIATTKLFFIVYMTVLLGFVTLSAYIALKEETIWYQTEKGLSGTTVNIYGTEVADVISGPHENKTKLWDPTDTVVPDQASDQFFIITKLERIYQTNGSCPEHQNVKEATCRNDDDCTRGTRFTHGNGITTGLCDNGTCQVQAWCPIEGSTDALRVLETEVMNGTENIFILIKNHLRFEFSESLENIHFVSNTFQPLFNNNSEPYCMHHDKNDTGTKCPFFTLKYILSKASDNSNRMMGSLLEEGGVIVIRLSWNCLFGDSSNCTDLVYSIDKLDHSSNSKGYNFTSTTYSYDNRSERMFVRATGILFYIQVDANGKRLSWQSMFQSIATAFVLARSARPAAHFLMLIFCAICFGCIKHGCWGNSTEEKVKPTAKVVDKSRTDAPDESVVGDVGQPVSRVDIEMEVTEENRTEVEF